MKKIIAFLLALLFLTSCNLVQTETTKDNITKPKDTETSTGTNEVIKSTGDDTSTNLTGNIQDSEIQEVVDDLGLKLQYRPPKSDIQISEDKKMEYTYSGQIMLEGYISTNEICQMGATMLEDNTDCIEEDKIKEIKFNVTNSSSDQFDKIDFISDILTVGCQEGQDIIINGKISNTELSKKLLNSNKDNTIKILVSKGFIDYGFGYNDCMSIFSDIELYSNSSDKEPGLTDLGKGLTKDEKNVYYNGEIIEGFDVDSFIAITPYHLKDKNHIYVKIYENRNNRYEIDDRFDANSFEIISHSYTGNNAYGFYAKDKNNYYFSFCYRGGCNLKILDGIDYESFEILDYPFAKDNYSVYYEGKIIEGADPQSFKIFKLNNEDSYGKDKNGVYYNWNKKELPKGADINSFEMLSRYRGGFSRDKDNVYRNNTKIDNVDINSFKKYNDFYLGDKKNIYCEPKYDGGEIPVLSGADPKTFEIVKGQYAKDQNNIYIYCDTLKGANLEDFSCTGNICRDSTNVYYEWGIIKGADPKTCQNIGDGYIKDAKTVYKIPEGVAPGGYFPIEGADPNTFEPLDEWYSKDKNNVYYDLKKLEGADLNTFQVLEHGKAKDKNGVYYDGNIVK